MTRKDYVLIAEALKAALPKGHLMHAVAVAQHMRDCEKVADALASDNPRFDRYRFREACGVLE